MPVDTVSNYAKRSNHRSLLGSVFLFVPLLIVALLVMLELYEIQIIPGRSNMPLALYAGGLLLTALAAWVRRGSARNILFSLTLAVFALAPLALLHPWATVPTHFPGGFGYGGAGLFRHWLTKYPNFGPINYEILLGILCLSGCVIGPVFFAYCAWRSPTSRAALFVFWVLTMACYIPVFIRLDLDLWYIAIYAPFDLDGATRLFFVGGPLIHAVSCAAMLLMLFFRLLPQNQTDPAAKPIPGAPAFPK